MEGIATLNQLGDGITWTSTWIQALPNTMRVCQWAVPHGYAKFDDKPWDLRVYPFSDKARCWKSTTKTERHGMKKWQEVGRFLVALRGSCWDINKLCEGAWVDPPVPQDNCQKIKICAGFTLFRKNKNKSQGFDVLCSWGHAHTKIYIYISNTHSVTGVAPAARFFQSNPWRKWTCRPGWRS